ncbi:MAG: hypothetical protein RIC89_20325, partial [Pseudomonadales bacterium]
IVSTTVTTIGGFVPLIVSGGTFWPPLATAIAGGVAGSAIIALYMVPACFRLFTANSHLEAAEQQVAFVTAAKPTTAATVQRDSRNLRVS